MLLIDALSGYSQAFMFFNTACLVTSSSRSPFRLGCKPKAGPENTVGNRRVFHFNFHGTALCPDPRIEAGSPNFTSADSLTKVAPIHIMGNHNFFTYALFLPGCGYQRYPSWLVEIFLNPAVYGVQIANYACWSPSIDSINLSQIRFSTRGDSGKLVSLAVTVDLLYASREQNVWKKRFPSAGSVKDVVKKIFGASFRYAPVLQVTGDCCRLTFTIEVESHIREKLMWRPYWAAGEQLMDALLHLDTTISGSAPASRRLSISGDGPSYDPNYFLKLRRKMVTEVRYLPRKPEGDTRVAYGNATGSAVESARKFTGNGFAYFSDLKNTLGEVKDLVKLLRGKVSAKSLSNLWLSYRYGLRLTVSDTRELVAGMVKVQKKYLDYAIARGLDPESGARAIIYYHDSPESIINRAVKVLMDWDLCPTFTNVWDLIPFSFVVDWFIDVESVANAIDARTYLSACEVVTTLYTWKRMVLVPTNWHGLTGTYTATYYERITPASPIMPVISLRGSLPSWQNVIDGAALLITN